MVTATEEYTKERTDRLKIFIKYMLDHKIISSTDFKKVMHVQNAIDKRIGHLASVKGYLSAKDVFYVVSQQIGISDRFGDVAIRCGLLTTEQVRTILNIQEDPFRLFMESLMICRVMEEDELPRLIQAYLGQNGNDAQEEFAEAKTEAEETPLGKPTDPILNEGKVQFRLRKIKSLATLPEIAQRVLGLLEDPTADLEEIADLIESDPGLSTQLLRLVNSSSFGMRNKVTKISKVLITMGFRGVRKFVLISAVFDMFSSTEKADQIIKIWTHSLVTAQWARKLLERKGHGVEVLEDAFMVGLLHNLGQMVIWQCFPENADSIMRLIEQGMSAEQAEKKILDLSHSDIGAFLCHFWKFPPQITQAVLYHHAEPAQIRRIGDDLELTIIINIACRLAELTPEHLGDGASINISSIPEEFVSFCGLDAGVPQHLLSAVVRDSQKQIELLLGSL